jgi:predicted phosphodiesterase
MSDTHAQHNGLTRQKPLRLPEGDVLIHAGDFLSWGSDLELLSFVLWLESQASKFKHILIVAGNHDKFLEQKPVNGRAVLSRIANLLYLQDSGVELDGVKFWGSPWTTEFQHWAFMRRPGFDMDKAWELIPEDTQVLITHSPPQGILDPGKYNSRIGCEMLAYRLGPDGNLKPKLHVFGHGHAGYGQEEHNGILHVNAALCNDNNVLINPPIELELEGIC